MVAEGLNLIVGIKVLKSLAKMWRTSVSDEQVHYLTYADVC